jgi:hypothetical protein
MAPPRRHHEHGTALTELPRTPRPQVINRLLGLRDQAEPLVLVSCGKAKLSHAAPAQQLYTSTLFRLSFEVARRVSSEVYILSAQHGLVSPDQILEPYEQSLQALSPEGKEAWRQSVLKEIQLVPPRTVMILAGGLYADGIGQVLSTAGWTVVSPLAGLKLGERLSHLKRLSKVFNRRDLANELYLSLSAAEKHNNRRPLEQLSGKVTLPDRGLYIFSDPDEESPLHRGAPRVVRIGTHGVSSGSKSTLRSRLRTHMGGASMSGSHRSSIFRLHVGEALQRSRGMIDNLLSWGKGSTAPKEVRVLEVALEEDVSRYIRRLLVSVIPISDESAPNSMRAIVERALIGLFTENSDYIETPGPTWLGNHSQRDVIARSGLWNLQHHGSHVDVQAIHLATNLLSIYQP